jgi:hypothetical protein
VNLSGLTIKGVAFSQNVQEALGTIVQRVSAEPHTYLVSARRRLWSLTVSPGAPTVAALSARPGSSRATRSSTGTHPMTPLFRQILRCIQRPCDIRPAQAISLAGERFQKAFAH